MSNHEEIGVYTVPGAHTPMKATFGSAAVDLRAFIPENGKVKVHDQNNKALEWPANGKIVVPPFFKVLIPTGIFLEMHDPWYALVFPRSSCWKTGLTLVNNVGLIDTDYRGELMAPMINLSDKNSVVENGDRIVQLMFRKKQDQELLFRTLQDQPELAGDRVGGFGSTGKV